MGIRRSGQQREAKVVAEGWEGVTQKGRAAEGTTEKGVEETVNCGRVVSR